MTKQLTKKTSISMLPCMTATVPRCLLGGAFRNLEQCNLSNFDCHEICGAYLYLSCLQASAYANGDTIKFTFVILVV